MSQTGAPPPGKKPDPPKGPLGFVRPAPKKPKKPRPRIGWGENRRPKHPREVEVFGQTATMEELHDFGSRKLKWTSRQMDQLLAREHAGNMTKFATAVGQRLYQQKKAEKEKKKQRRPTARTAPIPRPTVDPRAVKRETVAAGRQEASQSKAREARVMKNEEVGRARREAERADANRHNHGRAQPSASVGVGQPQVNVPRPPEDGAEAVQPRGRGAGEQAVAMPDQPTTVSNIRKSPRAALPAAAPEGSPRRPPASPAKPIRTATMSDVTATAIHRGHATFGGARLRGGAPGRAAPQSRPGARMERQLAEGVAKMEETRHLRREARRHRGESVETETTVTDTDTEDEKPIMGGRRSRRIQKQEERGGRRTYTEPPDIPAESFPGQETPESKKRKRMTADERAAARPAARPAAKRARPPDDPRARPRVGPVLPRLPHPGNLADDPALNPPEDTPSLPGLEAGSLPASGRASPQSVMSDMLSAAGSVGVVPDLPPERRRAPAVDAPAPAGRGPAPPDEKRDEPIKLDEVRQHVFYRGSETAPEVWDGVKWIKLSEMSEGDLTRAQSWNVSQVSKKWRQKKDPVIALLDEDKLVRKHYGYDDYRDMLDAHQIKRDGHQKWPRQFAKAIELAHDKEKKRRFMSDADHDFMADHHIDMFGHPHRGTHIRRESSPDDPDWFSGLDILGYAADAGDTGSEEDWGAASPYRAPSPATPRVGTYPSPFRRGTPKPARHVGRAAQRGRGRPIGHRGRGGPPRDPRGRIIGLPIRGARGAGRRGRGRGAAAAPAVNPPRAVVPHPHISRMANIARLRLESARAAVHNLRPGELSRWTHGKSFRGSHGRNPTPKLSVNHLGPNKFIFRAHRGVTRGIRQQIRHYLSRVKRYVYINGTRHTKKQAYNAVLELLEGNRGVEVELE